MRRVEHLECPAYQSPKIGYYGPEEDGLTGGIYSRRDMDYSRMLIQAPTTDAEESAWSTSEQCHIPKVDLYVS